MSKVNRQTLDLTALTRLPLNGRHLIEASAGTGKTYNITRLFIRLLLEKSLPVQNILVMTFTRAATEELRGRIAKEVRFIYENWSNPDVSDPFLDALKNTSLPETEVKGRLKQALLDMDEAAIFTIHGFCHRVLSQEAFASGLPMELTMEAESSALMIQAVQDWFRQVSQDEQKFALLEEAGWQTPDKFLAVFNTLISTDTPLVCLDEAAFSRQHDSAREKHFEKHYTRRKAAVLEGLLSNQSCIFSELVSNRKDESVRQEEWQTLLGWLESDVCADCPAEATRFFSGKRYARKEGDTKQKLNNIFEPVKSLVKSFTSEKKAWEKSVRDYLDSLSVNLLAREGIDSIRQSFVQARANHGQMDFNDLIDHLSCRLSSDESGQLADILRSRYPVALVDEFQDTDPKQYAILDALYPKSDPFHALFMIGDPKQAIYSFRGGDIHAYLSARNQADFQWHMATNWRSLEPVVEGYNRLFYGGSLDGKPTDVVFGNGITYDRIGFSSQAAATRTLLVDARGGPGAINYIWLPEIACPTGAYDKPSKEDWLKGLTHWCVSEIHALLQNAKLGDQPVQEKDIAILVRSGSEADRIRKALGRSGYSSVYLSDRTNVFQSAEATDMLTLLHGVLECENDSLLVAAVATRLWGGDATALAEFTREQGDLAWEAARSRAWALRDLWLKQGCMNMLLSLVHECYRPDPAHHERALTNVLHLIELLQQAARQYRQPQQLFKWYRDQCEHPDFAAEVEQRLESEGNLIRIVTQHKSKGLEYPIVFIPYATTYRDPTKTGGNSRASYARYHDEKNGQLICQLGWSQSAMAAMRDEGHAESIRLLYVAVTRASHRCYIGLAPLNNSIYSGMGLTLKVKNDTDWERCLTELVSSPGADIPDKSNCLIRITSETPLPEKGKAVVTETASLTPARFQATLDDQWRLASYSTMKKSAYQQATERQDKKDRDELSDDTSQGGKAAGQTLSELTTSEENLLRFTLKKGSKTGDLLHDILEQVDFSHPDWAIIVPLLHRFDPEADYRDRLIDWLEEILLAPIPVIGSDSRVFRLADLNRHHTLREAEFYFSMDKVNPGQLEQLLARHRGNSRVVHLSQGVVELSGMMHGFIDLVFEFEGKYYVADYKSTHLGNRRDDYRASALLQSIESQFYDLQYLIYSLALHRYLISMMGGEYRPEQHFGGVYYFYLRGMGPEVRVSESGGYPGIYSRAISAAELARLDRLFGRVSEQTVPEQTTEGEAL